MLGLKDCSPSKSKIVIIATAAGGGGVGLILLGVGIYKLWKRKQLASSRKREYKFPTTVSPTSSVPKKLSTDIVFEKQNQDGALDTEEGTIILGCP